MFILLPIGTDSPCYHPPFATGGLIFLNILVFIVQLTVPGFTDTFMLNHNQFNPLTWITSTVMHAGIGHLLGNMIILAICGWIVEGKVGCWQFLGMFFLIGFIANGMEQIMMLPFDSTGSLGASGAIFGLIAVVLIWAPENEVTIWGAVILLFYPYVFTFSASLMVVCFVLISLELLTAAFTGFQMSSAVLHLLGVVPGLAIGYLMVAYRLVDCEGFDLISIVRGKRGQRVLTVQQEKEQELIKAEAKAEARDQLRQGREKIGEYIAGGHYEMALHRYQSLQRKFPRLKLTEHQLVELIRGLWSNDTGQVKAVPLMETYLQEFTTLRVPLTLKLARYQLLVQQRPRVCMRWLKTLEGETLDTKQRQIAAQLSARAQQEIRSGMLDVADDLD